MSAVILLLLINSIAAFASVDNADGLLSNSTGVVTQFTFGKTHRVEAVASPYLTVIIRLGTSPGFYVPDEEVEILLTQYFTLVAVGGVVRWVVATLTM